MCNIFDDIDDSVWAWEAIYKYIIDQHIPLRMAKVRSNSLPWMCSSLRKELNKRYNLLLKAQKTPRGSPEWLAYKKQRNYCTKSLRSAETSYWNSKLTNAKSSREFWSLVRSLQGKRKCSTIGPVKSQSQSGSLITDNLSKANEFNSYFTNICSTLANTNSLSALDLSSQPVSHIYRISPT